ncbi:hypothetical protein ACOSQ2_023579 [Xanthoceras sorbifolium]
MQSLGTSSGEGAVLSEVAASPFVFVAKELSSGKGSPKKGDVSEAASRASKEFSENTAINRNNVRDKKGYL